MPVDTPVVVQMVNRLGVDNSGIHGSRFKYSMAWNNKPFEHDATMNEEKNLQKVMPGQFVQGKKVKNQYGNFMIFWDILTDQEVARAGLTAMPAPGGYSPTATNPEPPKEEKTDWEKIALSKIIHEFMKTGYSTGKDPMTCANDAETLTKLQFASVEKLSKEMIKSDFADDVTPAFNAPSVVHTPSIQASDLPF